MKQNISAGEKNLIDLSRGKKKPRTEKDRQLLNDIKKIRERGGTIYIPHD